MNDTSDSFVLKLFSIIDDLISTGYLIDETWRVGDDYLVDGVVDHLGELQDTYQIWRGDWYDDRAKPEIEDE